MSLYPSPTPARWSEEAYLDLTDRSDRRIELADGRLEFLPMPTEIHESLVQFLLFALHQFVTQHDLGKVYSTGIRVRIRPGNDRLPDVVFLRKDHYHLRHNRVWDGADLVMEVVSGDAKDRQRDYEQKFTDYAEAGIAEYWIVDPEQRVILVYTLQGGTYAVRGKFAEGTDADSLLLSGFKVDVTDLFAVIEDIPE